LWSLLGEDILVSMTKEIQHGHYTIKIMPAGSNYRARVYRGKVSVGDVFTGATLEAAVSTVKVFLDDRASAICANRAANGFPCADEVREAFEQLRMNPAQEAMLMAHRNAPNHILTATELAEAAGYDSYTVANSQYGKLGRDLAYHLDWAPNVRRDGTPVWTYALAEGADEQDRDHGAEFTAHWRWKLRPEVVEAWTG
jgi:hypothetical protein